MVTPTGYVLLALPHPGWVVPAYAHEWLARHPEEQR